MFAHEKDYGFAQARQREEIFAERAEAVWGCLLGYRHLLCSPLTFDHFTRGGCYTHSRPGGEAGLGRRAHGRGRGGGGTHPRWRRPSSRKVTRVCDKGPHCSRGLAGLHRTIRFLTSVCGPSNVRVAPGAAWEVQGGTHGKCRVSTSVCRPQTLPVHMREHPGSAERANI